MVLQVCGFQSGLAGQRLVPPQAGYKPVPAYLFDTQVGMLQGQRHDGGIDRPGHDLFCKFSRISVGRAK
jgi:hypothetical protein